MYKLYHHPACPFSRKVRIILNEVKAKHTLHEVKFWVANDELVKLNPAGNVPILVDKNYHVIYGNYAINEYLMEEYPMFSLQNKSVVEKTDYRMAMDWCENVFFTEVTKPIFEEKILNFLDRSSSPPDSGKIRQANRNLVKHIDYLQALLGDDYYLFDHKLTLADIVFASQISILDYVDSFNWKQSKEVKMWYSLVKSRPSFQNILQDRIANLNPPKHYSDPDF
ncbi:glutathione S-transferase family protein [Candidatus Bandiella euplotis]|uniref:Glutathione S-transferase n=1 Tax=Candidatus Bandiella euplotis TaxID=1664265 RepID=A0ABZ0UML1_9RICK|nr:glutathione S-transferase family protein [Candidatus Bandiella woodruffii]WPX97167.1 Glutathione S-transferase [Candidatus Bandiella woodruffii]